jgi:hypothetical protein
MNATSELSYHSEEESGPRGESGRRLTLTEQVIARVVSRRYDEGLPGRRIGLRGDTT